MGNASSPLICGAKMNQSLWKKGRLIKHMASVQYARSLKRWWWICSGFYKLLASVGNEYKYKYYSPGLCPYQEMHWKVLCPTIMCDYQLLWSVFLQATVVKSQLGHLIYCESGGITFPLFNSHQRKRTRSGWFLKRYIFLFHLSLTQMHQIITVFGRIWWKKKIRAAITRNNVLKAATCEFISNKAEM